MQRTDDFTIRELATEGRVNIELCGELDLAVAGWVRDKLMSAAAQAQLLVIDAAPLTFIDSTGLAVLIATRRCVADGGGEMVIVNASRQLRRLVELTGAADLLGVR